MKLLHAFIIPVVGLGMQFALAAPALADQASVVSGCSGGGDCSALVSAYINDLKSTNTSAADLDAAMADLTVALGEAAQGINSPAVKAAIASGIRTASAAVADAAQRRRIYDIALAVENDQDDSIPQTAASGA
ncbi:MAG: hypothetical protein Q8Q62_04635 [Mesorhizobium sp.]|nr:hypothetical protein [Mesorhizobium sp.]